MSPATEIRLCVRLINNPATSPVRRRWAERRAALLISRELIKKES